MMAWQDKIVDALGANERTAFGESKWAAVESEVGCIFPQGFKSLIDRLGACCIGNFLWLPAPSHDNIYLNTTELVREAIYCYSKLNEVDPVGYARPSPPKEGAPMAFAVTGNGDYLSFICDPNNPDNWPVALCHEGVDFEEFLAGCVEEFFVALVENRLQCDGLPSDFLYKEMTFEPL